MEVDKITKGLILLLAGVLGGVLLTANKPRHAVVKQETRVYFSPHGGSTNEVVKAVDAAKVAVRVMAHTFTSQAVADALVRARERRVSVEVILDKKQVKDSQGPTLSSLGVVVLYDADHAEAHNSVIIIDATTVVSGSFNYTDAAESKNSENVIVFNNPTLASAFIGNYKVHRSHSKKQEK